LKSGTLNILFESSYKLGKLPNEWKLGHVIAVYKKGNKGDPSNYRPISLTSKGKGKVFPYSLPSVGPGADPGVQAVSPQVT